MAGYGTLISGGTRFCIGSQASRHAKTISSGKIVRTVELALELVRQFSTFPHNRPLWHCAYVTRTVTEPSFKNM